MRTAILIAILLLAACAVKKDPNNNAVTLGYDSQAAENGAKAVTHEATKIAGDIANDVKDTGSKIQSKIGEQTASSGATDNAADKSADKTGDKAPANKH
ncbi:MAG: hypothetical protein ABI422_06405 [Sphingomicrobium sp.]